MKNVLGEVDYELGSNYYSSELSRHSRKYMFPITNQFPLYFVTFLLISLLEE